MLQHAFITRGQALQTVKLTLSFRRGTREIVVSDSVLDMLSEPTRKIVTDKSIDDNQRFKLLLEELHWAKELSTHKVAEKLNVKSQKTLWRMMKRLNVRTRDKITATRLASTGRYKYPKRDFDGSVRLVGQQLNVTLFTPDPYLALLFKELFGRYGRVSLAPCRNSYGRYEWQLWIYLPFKSLQWLLDKRVPALMDEDRLYDALSAAIDAEGSISAWKRTRARTTRLRVFLYNEKVYVIEPLQHALARLGYNPRTSKTPKGRMASFGPLNSDCHRLTICDKANVKRLLERIKPTLYLKRLKDY